jgi:hypothetical protein
MTHLTVSLIALGCLLGGVLLGLGFQFLLPNRHLSKESQDTVKLDAGLVAIRWTASSGHPMRHCSRRWNSSGIKLPTVAWPTGGMACPGATSPGTRRK